MKYHMECMQLQEGCQYSFAFIGGGGGGGGEGVGSAVVVAVGDRGGGDLMWDVDGLGWGREQGDNRAV